MWPRRSKPEQPPPTSEQIRLKLLDLAAEGANALFMLPAEWTWPDGVVHPETSPEATRDALDELTRAGYIEIYAVRVGSYERLDLEAALTAIHDDRNWRPPGPAGAELLYEVAITESGDAEYWKLRRARESPDLIT